MFVLCKGGIKNNLLALDYNYLYRIGDEKANELMKKLDQVETIDEFKNLDNNKKREIATIASTGKDIDDLLKNAGEDDVFIWIDIISKNGKIEPRSGAGNYAGKNDYFSFSESFFKENPNTDKIKAFGPEGRLFVTFSGTNKEHVNYVFASKNKKLKTNDLDIKMKQSKKKVKQPKEILSFFRKNSEIQENENQKINKQEIKKENQNENDNQKIIDFAIRQLDKVENDSKNLKAVIITANGKNKLLYDDYREKIIEKWIGIDKNSKIFCVSCGQTKKQPRKTNSMEKNFFTTDRGADFSPPYKQIETEDNLNLCKDCLLTISAGISHVIYKQYVTCGSFSNLHLCLNDSYKQCENIAKKLRKNDKTSYFKYDTKESTKSHPILRHSNIELYVAISRSGTNIKLYPIYYGNFEHLNKPLDDKWIDLLNTGENNKVSRLDTWDILNTVFNVFDNNIKYINKANKKEKPQRRKEFLLILLNDFKTKKISKDYQEFLYMLNQDMLNEMPTKKGRSKNKKYHDLKKWWKEILCANLLSQMIKEGEGSNLNENTNNCSKKFFETIEQAKIKAERKGDQYSKDFFNEAEKYITGWNETEISLFALGALCAFVREYQSMNNYSSNWISQLGVINSRNEVLYFLSDVLSKIAFIQENGDKYPKGGKVIFTTLIPLTKKINKCNLKDLDFLSIPHTMMIGAAVYSFTTIGSNNNTEGDEKN